MTIRRQSILNIIRPKGFTLAITGIISLWVVMPLLGQTSNEQLQDISLEELLDTKISTAMKYSQTIGQAPASVTVITAEDIEHCGFRTLAGILSSVRGFYISNDRNYSYVGVRGFSRPTDYNNRILLLLNGHTINENIFGAAPIGREFTINPDIIERIEIVRGPGSVLYGTGAMFAVINVITKKSASLAGIRTAAEYSSFRTFGASAALGTQVDSKYELSFSGMAGKSGGQDLYYEEFDDPPTNNGRAAGLDDEAYYGVLATMSSRGLSLQGFLNSREKDVPTAAWGTVFNASPNKTLDQWRHVEAKYHYEYADDKSFIVRGYLDSYYYKGWFPYDAVAVDESHGLWIGSEIQYHWDLRQNNRLTIGGEYQNNLKARYCYRDGDTVYFDNDFPFYAVSVFIQDEYQIMRNLAIVLGIRRDRYNTPASTTTPRGAIIYSPVKSATCKILFGEAFRKPNIYEAHYNDPLGGYKDNPSLKAEKIQTTELVWEQRFSQNIRGFAAVYNYAMKNLIDQTVDPLDSLVQFRNISRVRARGVELEIDANWQTGFSGNINYAYQKATDRTLEQKLTNSPEHLAKLGITCHLPGGLETGTELYYESSRKTIQGRSTESFFLTNVNLNLNSSGHRHDFNNNILKHIKIGLGIRNVFDVKYYSPAGYEHVQNAIAQDGRNFALKLHYQFSR